MFFFYLILGQNHTKNNISLELKLVAKEVMGSKPLNISEQNFI